jgi:DDE superfamily endonuclease
MDPARFVFLDETGTATNMTRRYGRCPSGRRLAAAVPHGHWRTTTFVAGLRQSGVIAPLVLDGPMTGPAFRAYVEQFLAPALAPGDVVVLDNLAAHKVDGARRGRSLAPLPAALFAGSQPDRAAVRQAQGPVTQGRGAHPGRALVDHRPPHRHHPASRVRPLSQPLRLWGHLK